jgi:hypothetical protein
MRLMFLFVFLTVIVLCSLNACTDAERARLGSFGSPGEITCYSGGKVIYSGRSTGKINTVENSDGWQFKDAETNKFVRVSGDCVINN